jgi:hypothetical protein
MMDMNATFKASSYWDANWKNPRLDSKRGVHNGKKEGEKDQWWEVDMPGTDLYTFSGMTLMKRGDGCCKDRVIDAVRFQYSDDGENWTWYEDKKYVPTGQKK